MNRNIKIIRLKKHNWFVCLFSKKKREERKRWEARWGKHLTEAQEIEIIPMKYEPSKPAPFLDYKYKNAENAMKKLERYEYNCGAYFCTDEDVQELEAKYAELEAKYAELEAKCVELRACIARQGHVILTQHGEVMS